MGGILKLYLLGILISSPGVADQNEAHILKAQLQSAHRVMRAPLLNNYDTCLLSTKRKFAVCQRDFNSSIKTHTSSAHTIFRKQRNCEIKKEKNHTVCKSLFLK